MKRYTSNEPINYETKVIQVVKNGKVKNFTYYIPETDSTTKYNHGELCEIFAKAFFGETPIKDKQKIAFNVGSDIESLKMSVKSGTHGLMDLSHMNYNSAEEQINYFFKNVHSKKFCIVKHDTKNKTVDYFVMNKTEFKAYIKNCMVFTNSKSTTRKGSDYKLRAKDNKATYRWLLAQCE